MLQPEEKLTVSGLRSFSNVGYLYSKGSTQWISEKIMYAATVWAVTDLLHIFGQLFLMSMETPAKMTENQQLKILRDFQIQTGLTGQTGDD